MINFLYLWNIINEKFKEKTFMKFDCTEFESNDIDRKLTISNIKIIIHCT